MFSRTMPVMSVVSSVMPNSPCISEPENQCSLPTAIGYIVLKISHGWIQLLLQPLDRFLRVQRVHRSFQAGDNERPVVDEFELALRPASFINAKEFSQAANEPKRAHFL